MMKSKIYVLMVTALVLSSPMLITSVRASSFSQHDLDGITIDSGDYHGVELGTLAAGKEISITYSSSEEIDGLLMTDAQYQSWIAGSVEYILNGSELDDTLVIYTYTVETTDDYWYVLDNSAQNPNGVNSGSDSTISIGGINIVDRLTEGLHTRIVLEPGDTFSYDFGSVPQGNLLELSVTCEGWLFEDVDIFVVNGSNSDAFAAGNDVWNRNASYLDTCFERWSYEVESTDSFAIHIENGPRGEATQSSAPLRIDLRFSSRSLLPAEITKNTRMIETDESWRVDLGSRQAGDTLTFGLTLDGLFSQVDVLIMENSQADLFLSGQTANVLGHPSLINVDFFDAWDYRFPRSGSYTMIIDNTPEPQGGAYEGSPIHAEFYVIETTALSEWLGWYESRHFVEDGSFVSFDLGQLEAEAEFGYSVSGNSHGTGLLNAFDVLVFSDSEYQSYVSGTGGSPIESNSSLDQWIGAFENHAVAASGHYWIVIDAADGPTDGANANGAWTFDFMLTSEGSITSPQVEDANYEMTATNLGGNVPNSDGGDGGGDESDQPDQSDLDFDGVTNDIDDDDDGDGILDSSDLRPTSPDDVENSVSIIVTESEVRLSLIYISSPVTVMQVASIVDALSDNSGSIDTTVEKDTLESTLCASPAPLADLSSTTFSFTEWILNVTIDGAASTIKSDSCTWSDRRTIPTLSMFDSAELKVDYVLDIQSVEQPFTLMLPNISWTHPLFLPYNSPFSIDCVNEVANTDCLEQEYWYPLSGDLYLAIDGSGASLGEGNGPLDLGEAKSGGGLSPSLGVCGFLLVAIVVGVMMKRSKKLRGMPVMVYGTQQFPPMAVQATTGQVFQISQPAPVQATAAPQSGVIPSWEELPLGGMYDYSTGMTIYIAASGQRWVQQANGTFEAESAVYSQPQTPPPQMTGTPDEDGYEWLDADGVNWYRVTGSGSEWTKWE